MRRCARVIPAEYLIVPLLLMKAELALPGLEDLFFSLDDALLPCFVVSQASITITLVEQAVVALCTVLSSFGCGGLRHNRLSLAE